MKQINTEHPAAFKVLLITLFDFRIKNIDAVSSIINIMEAFEFLYCIVNLNCFDIFENRNIKHIIILFLLLLFP